MVKIRAFVSMINISHVPYQPEEILFRLDGFLFLGNEEERLRTAIQHHVMAG